MDGTARSVKSNERSSVLEQAESSPAALITVVADNVRALRERRAWSLSELAAAAGIGKSTLSLLESGKGNPNIETLWALARALDVPFGRIIEAAGPGVRVLRAGEGVRVDAAGSPYLARLLLSRTSRGAVELYEIASEPGPPRAADAHSPGVSEHLLVISGRMRVGPVDAAVELDAGDLASFSGDTAHVYETIEPDTRALLLMDYP